MAFSKTLKIVAKVHCEDTYWRYTLYRTDSFPGRNRKRDNCEEPFRGQDKSQTLTWGTIPSKKSEFDWKNL